MKPIAILFSLSLSLAFVLDAAAITLTGSNGRKVEFAGIKDASPKGITAQVTAESNLIGLTWDKFDLEAMKAEQPQIYAAYLTAMEGETVNLNLGTYMPADQKPTAAKPGNRQYEGWTHVKIADVNYLLQMPLSNTPQGILLVSVSDFGRAFQFLANWDRGTGPLADLQNKHKLAFLTYEFEIGNHDPTKEHDFMFPEKGSGKRLFEAIDIMAKDLDLPELSELPIAVYSTERVGAAFGYNLIQFKPERFAAAFIGKGAFFKGEPSAESAKIPIFFLRGEYSNQPELWQTEDTAEKVLAAAAPLKPNWTLGVEFRGPGHMTLECEYAGRMYLDEMLSQRLVERKPKPKPAETEAAGEGEAKAETATGEEEPEEEIEEEPRLKELDRSVGMVGNLEEETLVKMTDPDAVLGENETFIPNETIGKLWKDLLTGELEPPLPQQPN